MNCSLQGWAEQGSTGRRKNKCNLGPKKFSPENPIMSLWGRQGDKGHFVLSNGTTERPCVMMGSLYSLGFHSLPTSLSHFSFQTHPTHTLTHYTQYSTAGRV